MRETQREEETKSVSCEQPLTGCPTAALEPISICHDQLPPCQWSVYFLNTDFFSIAIWFKFY